MSKIHSFYFSNCKKEFNYFGQNLSEDEVKKFLIDSAQFCLEETENDEEELLEIDEDDYEELDSLNEIALLIKDDSDSDDSLVESEVQDKESTEYNPQKLVERILNIENNYGGNYKNDYKNNNNNKSNNSLDIEKDKNSDNGDNNQIVKVTKFSKTHNLRQRKHRQSEE